MKVKIVDFGVVDSDGDVFYRESIIMPIGTVYVTKDFDRSRVIGSCELSIDDYGVYAKIKFAKTILGQSIKKIFPKSVYPCIGFSRVGDKIKIYEVGLCERETISDFNKFEIQLPINK